MQDLSKRIANLSLEKRDLLLKKIIDQRRKRSKAKTIPARQDDAPLISTFAQEGIYFECKLEPDCVRYNGSCHIKITGALDTGVLEDSLNHIIKRHEILRAVFNVSDAKVMIKILPELTLPLRQMSIQERQGDERESLFGEILKKEHVTVFNLESGPLLTFLLVQTAEQIYSLIITMHHIISDEWSLDVMLAELVHIYKARITGSPVQSPELEIQYPDFSIWQRENLSSEKIKENINYWENILKQEIPDIQMPFFHNGLKKDYMGNLVSVHIDGELKNKIEDLAKQRNITLFVLLLSVYYILLYYYSRQNDLLVNCPLIDRRWSETENLIGYFLTTLFFRSTLSDDQGFESLLKENKKMVLDAFSHMDITVQHLYAILRKYKNLNKHTINNIAFNYIDGTHRKSYRVDGVQFGAAEMFFSTAVNNLSLMLIKQEDEIRGWFRYREILFSEDIIRDMSLNFVEILRIIVADPRSKISDIYRFLSENNSIFENTNKVIRKVNNTECDFRPPVFIHRIFEKHAEMNPDKEALLFGDEVITYKELNERVNRLSHYLTSRGVQTETPVGIALERSPSMVICILAVLKAGGCYVPLDPEFPSERLHYLTGDSCIRFVLSVNKFLRTFKSECTFEIICLDRIPLELNNCSHKNPDTDINIDNLAYILYTSGSTGKPKGVMITHRNLFYYFSWLQKDFPLRNTETILLKTPLTFDVSVRELFWAFFAGATLDVAKPKGHMDPEYLIHEMDKHKIRTCNFVPSMLKVFVEKGGIHSCQYLKRIFSGGEVLRPQLKNEILKRSDIELLNFYGLTECTITSTYYVCEPDTDRIVIGRPISNVRAYILGNDLNPLPIGVPGELYIGGAGLARGYVDRPGVTSHSFIPSPVHGAPRGRLYKTGDRARLAPDGYIEYLGRIDHQVKIRGMRVELGEIESVLNEHPLVNDSVVVVKKEISENQRLVAYFIPADSGSSDIIEQLNTFLKNRLPSYLVPSAYVRMEEFPLNVNGKVDRQRLPEPPAERLLAVSEYTKPETQLEKNLCTVWQEVLSLERVGIHDNFFDVGGHSLLLYKVLDKINDMVEKKIEIVDLFEYPTIRSLIDHIFGKDLSMKSSIRARMAKKRERLMGKMRMKK